MNSKGSIFLIFIACICSLSIAGCGNKYKNNYIKNPHVSVFVKEHRSQKVTVVGEVENPGTYDYPSRQRLVDALAIAGGLTESAGQIVHIRRLSSVSEVSSQDSAGVGNGCPMIIQPAGSHRQTERNIGFHVAWTGSNTAAGNYYGPE